MSRERWRLLTFLVVIAAFAYYYLAFPRVEVDAAVRPYIERCLDLIIESDYEPIYDSYLRAHSLSLDEFSSRIDYFARVFEAAPKSYSYSGSYVGGIGYFMRYELLLHDGQTHTCTFHFPAKDGGVIGADDLEGMSVSADFGERIFQIDFESGDVFACRADEGCYGDGSVE